MTELPRLRDDAESTVELLLLDAGVSYRSTPNARAKTLAALGLAGSAAVSAGAVSVAGSSLLGKLGWGKLLVISGIGASVIAPIGYVAWNRLHPGVIAVPAAAHLARVTAPAPVLRTLPVQLPAATQAEAPAVLTKPEAKPAASNGLAAELVALDAARAKLSNGKPSAALLSLDDYARAYPRGRLELEAEVLRIDALAKSGQAAAAKKRAESFLRRHPNSVLASRVRGYLG